MDISMDISMCMCMDISMDISMCMCMNISMDISMCMCMDISTASLAIVMCVSVSDFKRVTERETSRPTA